MKQPTRKPQTQQNKEKKAVANIAGQQYVATNQSGRVGKGSSTDDFITQTPNTVHVFNNEVELDQNARGIQHQKLFIPM